MLWDKGLCSQDCVFGFGLRGSELGEKNGNGPYTKQNRIYNLKKKGYPGSDNNTWIRHPAVAAEVIQKCRQSAHCNKDFLIFHI